MAFSLSVGYYSDVQTQSLTDHNPFFMEGAEGISSVPVTRYGQRGPAQNGITDLGFYIQPRILMLTVFFYATTDSQLDSYRSTLFAIFHPSWNVTLTLTRDDGTTRALSCVVVDDIPIDIDPAMRPSHLHRATIRLRADDPRWYNPTAGTPSFTFSTANWWLAGGAIGSANVMDHQNNINGAVPWSYLGTINGAWSIVFRTEMGTTDLETAYHAGTGALQAANTKDARFYYKASSAQYMIDGNMPTTATYTSGTPNVMVVHEANPFDITTIYYGETQAGISGVLDVNISGTARYWRADRLGSISTQWANPLYKAAIYDIALSSAQRSTLNGYMADMPIGTITTVNSGDTNEYPLITMQGPLYNPIIINTTTSSTIDLTGLNLGSGDIYTIDLRYGDKTIIDNFGSSQMAGAGTANLLGLAGFYLAPAPVASGGTNYITVQAGSISTNAYIRVTYYNRYMSW